MDSSVLRHEYFLEMETLRAYEHFQLLSPSWISGIFCLLGQVSFGFSEGLGIESTQITWSQTKPCLGSQCFGHELIASWSQEGITPRPSAETCWDRQVYGHLSTLSLEESSTGPVRKQETRQLIFSLGPEACKTNCPAGFACQEQRDRLSPASALWTCREHRVLHLKYALYSLCYGNCPHKMSQGTPEKTSPI